MSASASKRSRGRPAQPEAALRANVLDAATRLMLERGYAAMTMEAVAKEAGAAKKTVYRFAASREELLGLIVRNWTDTFVPAFEARVSNGAALAEALHDILLTIALRVLSAEAVGLYRLLVNELPAREEILAIYHRNGIERSRAMLADWLHAHRALGAARLGDAAIASDLILSMVIAEPLRQIAIGQAQPLPAWDVRSRIRAALQLLGLAEEERPGRPSR